MTKRSQGAVKAKLPVPRKTSGVRSKKRPPAKVTRWGTDWSWSKMIDVLSRPDEARQERLSAARDLLGLQEDGFRRLREAIEDPLQPEVSWESPFLCLCREFPYEWDTEVPLSAVDATDEQRNLLISLATLTGGVAVQPKDGDYAPLLPSPLRNAVSGFTANERETYLNAWFDDSSFDPLSFGDHCLADPEEGTISRIGSRGLDFDAALSFSISPRLIDHDQRWSGYLFMIGVPWDAEDGAFPKDWSRGEKSAFWKLVFRFLLTIRKHLENPSAAPSEVVEPVLSRSPSAGSVRFVASLKSSQGVSYFEKACVPHISETVLARVPAYARGGQGPVVDITDGEGHLQNLAALTVLSVMLQPDDEAGRKALLAGMHLRILESSGRDVLETLPSPEMKAVLWPEILAAAPKLGFLPVSLSQVLGSATSREEAEKLVSRIVPTGVLVGELLRFIVTCQAIGEPLGVTQAVPILILGLSEGRLDLGGIPYREKSAILREWSRYKSVAHFWGAFAMQREEVDSAFALKPGSELSFLALAEELRRRGENCFARAQKRKKGPVLDPSTTWRTPADLELPTIDISFPALSDWVLEYLGKRSRPTRRNETTPGAVSPNA